MIFYIKSEFRLDDLEWFFCRPALDDAIDAGIDIVLGNFKSDDFFIVIFNRERHIVFTMIARNLIILTPFI